jgi:hypothetical protein
MLLRLKLPIDDIYEVTSNTPEGHDLTYIREIIQEILSEILEERSEDALTTMRVQLGKQGVMVSEPDDHASEESYCAECSIY